MWITTDDGGKNMDRKPTHPGTVFLEDVMKPLNLTVTEAARMLGVSRKALSEFVNEKASLSPEMAIRISKATNTSVESWMNMQQKLTLWYAHIHEPDNVIPFPLQAAKEG
jgi:addiction module HigA family antidote